jgi:hypothetical protein
VAGKSSIVLALLALVLIPSCFTSKYNLAPGPPAFGDAGNWDGFQTVRIERVDIPASITVNQPAVLTLHISANAAPKTLQGLIETRLFSRTTAAAFSQGITEGRYDEGQFHGLYASSSAVAASDLPLGQAAATMQLPVTFSTPEPHVLYLGHNRQSADGGQVTAWENTAEYPAESDSIEYLKVVLDVQP